MRFERTELEEVILVHQEPRYDERGFFSRIYCELEFEQAGLNFSPTQMNRSLSSKKFTLRGMHYQINESAEEKYIRVLSGSIYDVAIDIRQSSNTYLKHVGILLTSDKPCGLFIPKGFAHGMLTMSENTEIEYLVSSSFSATNERGLRWNDPSLNINWPAEPDCISEKDFNWPLL
jgi:dTDP-4-dehydrorhamnose 3,5-epimerase